MQESVGFGLIGCGVMGKVHALAFETSPLVRFVTACDLDEKRAVQFAREPNAEKHMTNWRKANETVAITAADYNERADGGDFPPIYQLGENVVESEDLTISASEIRIPGFGKAVNLDVDNPYKDMTGKN